MDVNLALWLQVHLQTNKTQQIKSVTYFIEYMLCKLKMQMHSCVSTKVLTAQEFRQTTKQVGQAQQVGQITKVMMTRCFRL